MAAMLLFTAAFTHVISSALHIVRAPAPSPAPSPGPGPVPAEFGVMKALDPAPEQGYNEFGDDSEMVNHNDRTTALGDWRTEWPMVDNTEKGLKKSICENTKSVYCKLWLRSLSGKPAPKSDDT